MELPTPSCVVRSYRPDDAASLAAHGNNRKIWLNLRDRFPHPFSAIERLSAELGYWLGEAFCGRGIVSDAVAAMTEFGFRQLHLARIFAVPFAHNTASHRVLEKAGYEREGVLRASAIKDGQILDEYLYARVNSELT